MRRQFSTFARGWPALGLLLIRIVAGAYLIIASIAKLHADPQLVALILGVLAAGVGALLVAGLWTPIAGLLSVAVSAAEIHILHADAISGILLASMGAAVALVGPGGISVDAWLFGSKRIDIDKLNGSGHG